MVAPPARITSGTLCFPPYLSHRLRSAPPARTARPREDPEFYWLAFAPPPHSGSMYWLGLPVGGVFVSPASVLGLCSLEARRGVPSIPCGVGRLPVAKLTGCAGEGWWGLRWVWLLLLGPWGGLARVRPSMGPSSVRCWARWAHGRSGSTLFAPRWGRPGHPSGARPGAESEF